MNEQELQEIEERANKATPGPWMEVAESGEWWIAGPDASENFVMATNASENILQADIDFIAHARADVPALIAEVRSLRAKRAVPVGAIAYLMADIAPTDGFDEADQHEARAVVVAWLESLEVDEVQP